ncbi:MAG: class I SAM-dependent methyltransferase [Candidatus Thorarchaeota archaeon]|jgi:predicted methyltransferase
MSSKEFSTDALFLDAFTAHRLLAAYDIGATEVEVSLDLGITTQRIKLEDQPWNVEQLQKVANDTESVYFVNDDGIFKAALRGKHFYKLMPVGKNQAPALLIDGVLMHRVKEVTPMEDARMKAELCARKGIDMLEICTGLGYASIACLNKGIRSIVTIEKDKNVIELARLNPWSRSLFSDNRVSTINADATKEIKNLGENSFHAIMHDPPRFSMAPELYTTEFYGQLCRVLKRKGVLLHYVGSPGSKHRKRDLQKGIMKRLRVAGFKEVSRKEMVLGVLAAKR